MANEYNPIRSVNGATVPCPSVYQWKLSDVSAPDAGRTEAAVMDKMRVAQKVHIELSWNNMSNAETAQILQAFNPEYINVNYLDAMAGGYRTKTFYVGDRSSPLYNSLLGIWSNITFNIIER